MAFGRMSVVSHISTSRPQDEFTNTFNYDANGLLTYSGHSVTADQTTSASGSKKKYVQHGTDYVYHFDELYDMTNPWRAVFGWEGFVALIKEYENKENSLTVNQLITSVELDYATNKIKDISFSTTGDIVAPEVTVDGKGHITKVVNRSSDGSVTTNNYIWEGDLCVRTEGSEVYSGGTQTWTTEYTYGEHSLTIRETSSFSDPVTTVITETPHTDDPRRKDRRSENRICVQS